MLWPELVVAVVRQGIVERISLSGVILVGKEVEIVALESSVVDKGVFSFVDVRSYKQA